MLSVSGVELLELLVASREFSAEVASKCFPWGSRKDWVRLKEGMLFNSCSVSDLGAIRGEELEVAGTER